MAQKEQVLKQSNTIAIENLPSSYNQLLLQELLTNYPGVAEYNLQLEKQRATVRFHTTNDAKLAVGGKNHFN